MKIADASFKVVNNAALKRFLLIIIGYFYRELSNTGTLHEESLLLQELSEK